MSTAPNVSGPNALIQRFMSTLQARGVTGHCPFCSKNSWIVHETPASIPVYEPSLELRIPGTNMPMATMICSNCGWTGLFSLGALGLLRNQNAPAPGAPPVAPPAPAPAAPPAATEPDVAL